MKRYIVLAIIIILCITYMFGCGDGNKPNPNPTPTPAATATPTATSTFIGGFSENFQAFTTSSHCPPTGWLGWWGSALWEFLSDSGNMVLHHTTGNGCLIFDNYSALNYTVTAKIKPSSTSTRVGLIARYDVVSVNFYALTMESTNGFKLWKYVSGSGNAVDSSVFVFDTSKYYTLTLQVNNNSINVTVTDGTTTATINYNDGSALGAGKAGLIELQDGSSCFDDITVAE